jgi:hypothetical protein
MMMMMMMWTLQAVSRRRVRRTWGEVPELIGEHANQDSVQQHRGPPVPVTATKAHAIPGCHATPPEPAPVPPDFPTPLLALALSSDDENTPVCSTWAVDYDYENEPVWPTWAVAALFRGASADGPWKSRSRQYVLEDCFCRYGVFKQPRYTHLCLRRKKKRSRSTRSA